MLTYRRGQGFERPDLAEFEIGRLERLLADLKAMRNGRAPSGPELAEAPILDRYLQGVRPVPCLVGEASGHPTLQGVGRLIYTSDLWVHAPEAGWARTLSRWYRLGRMAGPGSPGGRA